MIFKLENLGSIKEAEIEMGNLTVICGKNNTGKTYLTYAVWGLIEAYPGFAVLRGGSNDYRTIDKNNIVRRLNEGEEVELDMSLLDSDIKDLKISTIEGRFSSLSKVFSTNKNYFKLTKISLNKENIKLNYLIKNSGVINATESHLSYEQKEESSILKLKLDNFLNINIEDEFLEVALDVIFYKIITERTFLLTAQRESIQLFYKDIDSNRNHLLRQIRDSGDLTSLEKNTSRFALPVERNIDFARDLTSQVHKTDSFLKESYPELIEEIENMLGVNYIIQNDAILVEDKNTKSIIPDYMASTSVRSLMYLHFWLKHRAQKGDVLMIDEPELSIHPENQIKIARLLVKLVNVGIKVWITTHSDYIVKELNNCLMLSQNFEGKAQLMSELGYKENEILKEEDIRYYTAFHDENLGGCTVKRNHVGKYGIEAPSFDDTLEQVVYNSERIQNAI